jgi:ABC-2 type transport system ATP-binding protein
MSTHVLYEVERVTSDVVLIHNGKALAMGNIQQIRALIDRHPHAVRIASPRPREVAEAVTPLDHVVSIEFPASGELLVRTRKPDAFYRELPGVVLTHHLEVTRLESPDDNLEAVFRYLVG